jgi:hypothetical protein
MPEVKNEFRLYNVKIVVSAVISKLPARAR